MLDRFFGLSQQGTNVRTEVLAGVTTFLTMAYIIFVQPAVLSGRMFGMQPEVMDFGAVTTATCVSAALATLIMGLYARYPIAQAPGMGENFFFVLTVLPAAGAMIDAGVKAGTMVPGQTEPWKIGLGVVFVSGVLFMGLTIGGLRKALLDTINPSLRSAIAVGIGLFIAFIGMRNAGLIQLARGQIGLNPHFGSPDLVVFFFGLVLTAGLFAMRIRGAIFWGILASTAIAVVLRWALAHGGDALQQSAAVAQSMLMTRFEVAHALVSTPPSMAPTFLEMDLIGALSPPMLPFILIFLFMVVFDTLGTLVGVADRAGLMRDGELPRANQAFLSDAAATVVGAACGTSTVTSFIESVAGVEQGGRTGLTAVVVAVLFLLALFFSPVIAMVGSYAPITAPALVIVGSMMMHGVTRVEWSNFAEAMPAFLIIAGIPLSYSIADGLALGFITYPILKLLAGQGRDVKWLMYVIAAVLVVYFVAVRSWAGG
ncbi:MAG: NCS2 family permease [Thermoguttaceae bacterium]|nr:NCS2 family permease [Thermoguttaceae bacterium]